MKRSGMPARTVPLRRGKALLRGAASIGGGASAFAVAGLRPKRRRHVASNTPARREDLTPMQRGLLYARYDGMCESQLSPRCPKRLPEKGWQAGHRTNRGRGGNNTDLWGRTANCSWCNYYQEDHPAEAETRGLYLRSGLNPRTEPIVLPDGREVFLLADGRHLEVR